MRASIRRSASTRPAGMVRVRQAGFDEPARQVLVSTVPVPLLLGAAPRAHAPRRPVTGARLAAGRGPRRVGPVEGVHAVAGQLGRRRVRDSRCPRSPGGSSPSPTPSAGSNSSTGTLLTRRERLFGVGKVRAAALMKTFGAELVGNQRILPRTRLLQASSKKHRGRAAFRVEEERRRARVHRAPAGALSQAPRQRTKRPGGRGGFLPARNRVWRRRLSRTTWPRPTSARARHERA